jgi:hypothetical protein
MRKTLAVTLALVVAVAAGRAADDADTARAVIQRAVAAQGGLDSLGKLKTQVRTAKGEINLIGGAIPATCETIAELPGKGRWTMELDKGTEKIKITLVVNGDKGWQSSYGATKEMGKTQIEEVSDQLYVIWVTSLVALREPGFELAALPDIKVGDKPAAGVKISRKGKADLKLYFDKKTDLLLKAEHKTKEGGLEVNREYFFSEPKDFDGLKLPTKQVVFDNGNKKVAEWTIGYKFTGKPDDKTFEKP